MRRMLTHALCQIYMLLCVGHSLLGQGGTSPQRIVSTSLASDEILLALLTDRRRLVATSALSANKNYSNVYASKYAHLATNSVEKIIAKRPDLIIYTIFNHPQFLIDSKKIPSKKLMLKDFSHIEAILENILLVGEAIGETTSAQRLVFSLKSRLKRLQKFTPKSKPKLINYFPDNTLMGTNTLFSDIVHKAGGMNVAADIGIKNFEKISNEVLMHLQPDYIVVPMHTDKHTMPQVWQKLIAMRSAKLIPVSMNKLMATSHYVVHACEKINAYLQEQKPISLRK